MSSMEANEFDKKNQELQVLLSNLDDVCERATKNSLFSEWHQALLDKTQEVLKELNEIGSQKFFIRSRENKEQQEYEEYIDNKDYKDYRVSLVSKINGKKISFYNDRDLHTSAGSIPEKVSFYTSSFASENKSII